MSRRWYWVILAWVVLAIFLPRAAPSWNSITHDGDLAYLPAEMPSVVGQRLLSEAFPANRSKSQIVVVVARREGRFEEQELKAAFGLVERIDALCSRHQLPILDVWSWRDEEFGRKLISEDGAARLILLHLSNEFLATDNIRVLEEVESVVAEFRGQLPESLAARLEFGISGSAAVGGDMLRASRDSIKNTELITALLVVIILALVYRSPLLVVVPLITIVVSLVVSTSAVALLTQLDAVPGFGWWGLKVFTTTRIFIVVILFGAGTDYCLFLISRYREELATESDRGRALTRALGGVGDALVASALTTILGLATMFFADFGKFRYSGPVIGLCLAVTLLTCLTLTPALLRALGPAVFWPFGIERRRPQGGAAAWGGRAESFWNAVARGIVARPGLILTLSVLVLLPLAVHGWQKADYVTYDLLASLDDSRPSKQGALLLKRHFPVGESGPITVVARVEGADFHSPEGRREIQKLKEALYLPGVRAVRSVTDPLGDFPPGRRISIRQLRHWAKREHKRAEALFISSQPEYRNTVTRFDLVLDCDPFSWRAIQILRTLDNELRSNRLAAGSFWQGCTFAYAGVTAGIRDLRAVTTSDNTRIQQLVVLAVLGVLLIILRRPLISAYMILTVLLSYYVTLGATQWFFAAWYGSSYQGLDWKVPLFLFVILVAVGEDYNVYLATRVFEEQQRRGPFAGLKYAIARTGGIITSCGVIMAGTFFSMTSGAWGEVFPAWRPLVGQGALRGIVELGFALALGVLLDTFIVRPVLVPAFLALLCRRGTRRESPSVYLGAREKLPSSSR